MASTSTTYLARTAVALVLLLVGACGTGSDAGPETTSSPPTSSAPASTAPAEGLTLVVIGDSIPYNAPEDCPDCTAFADLYAQELEQATGQIVEVQNFSDHTGLTVERLLQGLEPLKDYLSEADVIVVGIAHNSSELSAERPCGEPLTDENFPQWDAVDPACAARAADHYRPLYDRLYERVAATREGQPAVLLTLNRYNDWIGYAEADLTAAEERRTTVVLDAWNSMLCASAERHGFACADLYQAFNGANGGRPSGDLLAQDYTHPSQRGNDVIAEVLVDLGFAPLA